MPDIYIASKKKRANKKKAKAIKQTTNPLAAFVVNPPNIRFETQEKKEKIILLLRPHWFTSLPWIGLVILMTFVPFFLRFLPFLEQFPFRYQVIIVVLWYLLTLAVALENFLSWYFNVNIVTDERIVDIDFYSLIYKEISHCKIDKIQDISFKMGGIARTIFDYGDVVIQTAAEIPVFEFDSVPKPALVVQKLNELIIEEEKEALEGRTR